MHTALPRAARPWLQTLAPAATRSLTTTKSSTVIPTSGCYGCSGCAGCSNGLWIPKVLAPSKLPVQQLQQRRWKGDSAAADDGDDDDDQYEEGEEDDADEGWIERRADDDNDRTRKIPLETALAYMNSAAYRET